MTIREKSEITILYLREEAKEAVKTTNQLKKEGYRIREFHIATENEIGYYVLNNETKENI